jgi:diguanylate cyclase (GGDEF)-like protein
LAAAYTVHNLIAAAPKQEPQLQQEELRELHILRRVALESVWGMLEACPIEPLQPGEVLLEAGKSNQTMYMVLAGRLTVHLDGPKGEAIATLQAGETVGELSLLDDHPVSAYVVAAEKCRLLAVDELTFWRLVGASHAFATNLLFMLSHRMRANNAALAEGAKMRRQFERDATMDALTNVYNRRWLEDRLPRLFARHRRAQSPLSLLVVDVDHFKRFNDEYGHLAGDAVLSTLGRTLASSIRPTDLAARYGGEEFVVLLPDTDVAGGRAVAERLRRAIARERVMGPDGTPLPAITISVGVAELRPGDADMAAVIERADGNLYRAKQAGRNRVEG